MSFDQIIRLA